MLLVPRPATASSEKTNTTWRYDVFGHPRLGKGATIFTGPDGLRNYRAAVKTDSQYVGEGLQSIERTSSASYVWRPPPGAFHPKPKSAFTGSYGWGVSDYATIKEPSGSARMKMNTFRQATEQKVTHLYQNAWYPGPHEIIKPNSDGALVMNVYAPHPKNLSSSRAPGLTASPSENVGSMYSVKSIRQRMLTRQQESRSVSSSQEGVHEGAATSR